MSVRLPTGGWQIDRSQPVNITFNGRRLRAFRGDTVASALLANNQTLVGRSFKYHRPRGIIASGPEEPNGLVTVKTRYGSMPNQRATAVEVAEGMEVYSQNHWPSLDYDIGELADKVSPLLPAGFYYKTFIRPRQAWKHLYEPVIRRAAGLGIASMDRDPASHEHYHAHVDVLIVGAGVAGITAAMALAPTGLRILMLEQSGIAGGRLTSDQSSIRGMPAADWLQDQLDQLSEYRNVAFRTRTTVTGMYDHGYVLADERLVGAGGAVDHRIWRIRARGIMLASGAIERPLCFSGNDRPGVMLASAVRDYVSRFGVSPGDRTVVVTNNDDAYRTALVLAEAGLSVPSILDIRTDSDGDLPDLARSKGINVRFNQAVTRVVGYKSVRGVVVCTQVGEGTGSDVIDCECIAMSGGWSPAVHLWSHCAGKLYWDDAGVQYRPDHDRPPVSDEGKQIMYPAGSANGDHELRQIVEGSWQAGSTLAGHLGVDVVGRCANDHETCVEAPLQPAWLVPEGMSEKDRTRSWVDFQNDVKVSDVELAAREGYESPEHAKRYTTLGMATDQGKTSNVVGLAILSRALGRPMGKAVTTTFRPPYVPVPFGAIAGQSRGDIFMPVRKTPMDGWHDDNGAIWEPVAAWRRPYCYLGESENIEDAVNRESRRVRSTAGLLDATTLGKILVAGPDAGLFLDRMYTNMISTLPVGKCRYGLMCNEDGFLIDDGVVARIDDETFLCHTTTGGADHIHGWMEEWLQTEWWDLRVYAANMTEQYAQVGIAGPDARNVLEKVADIDLGNAAFPFMTWQDAEVAGMQARVFRISFSGELSYEIAVNGTGGMKLWNALLEAGSEYDIEPYGTEALHVLRAEKGYIIIGDETDGTVTPHDVNLGWAVSRKKDDFIGMRGLLRSNLDRKDRWQLVGLDNSEIRKPLPIGAHAVSEESSEYGHPRMIGRVTSSYYSPIMDRAIALALVESGNERMGETLEFVDGDRKLAAKVVSPVFYDPEGEQLRA